MRVVSIKTLVWREGSHAKNRSPYGWLRYGVLLLGARDGLFHPDVRLAFVFVVDFAEPRVSHEAILTFESSLGVQAHFGRPRFGGGAFAFFDEHAPKTAFALLREHRYAADSPAR